MIVWGGSVGAPFNTGGRYQPSADSWRATSLTNAPAARFGHTAVWTGSEMIVWGGGVGVSGDLVNTGGRYCAQPPLPPLTIIQPNGGEVWAGGSVQQIKWDGNLKHTDHLIIQYSRDGGASWFRIAQDVPAFTVRLLVASRQFPYHSGQGEDLVAGKSVDHRPERRELHCAEAVDHAQPEMKTKSKISGHIFRGTAWAVFLSVAFIAASSASNSPNTGHKSAGAVGAYGKTAKTSSQSRAFSFAERVAYQRAIEDVYWRHRIWPKENPNPKPSLDAVMSQAQLENKVASYLRDSLALEDYWQQPITAEQLQAEMDRMARDTKQPEVLRELFEALGNDPAVIAECLARPTLAERLIADLSAQDQTRHVESPQTDALRTMSVATTLGQVVYTLPEIADAVHR